jgi:hypothetical protein
MSSTKKLAHFAMLLLSVTILGCAAGGMQKVTTTGFLNDYSKLKPGGEDRAALLYVKPGADFKPYNKIMFDRVTVWLTFDAENRSVDPAMLKEMTDYYQNALFEAVKGGYEIVDKPGPGVLRVRVAITDVKPSNPVGNTMSTIVPVGIVMAGATKATSGDNLGTGEASTEMQILDAQTGEVLGEAVDRRQGGKGAFRGKWDDTKEAFDFWAKRFRTRLDEAHGKGK